MRTALDTPIRRDARSASPGRARPRRRSAQAVAAGVTIEMESETEARRVVAAGDALGLRPRVAVRVNPDFAVKGSGMRMGGGPQQFGVDAEQVPALLAELAAARVDFLGFHVFAGSQNLNAEIICEAQRKTVELVLELARVGARPGALRQPRRRVRHPVLRPGRSRSTSARVGENLAELLDERDPARAARGRVVIELGRYLVGECGVYVTRVVDRKVSRGRTFLVVDGGMHHQLAASGNFGQVIRRNYPVAVGNRASSEPTDDGHGRRLPCTPLDLLGDDVEPAASRRRRPRRGLPGGAYGLTASPTAFLGHPGARRGPRVAESPSERNMDGPRPSDTRRSEGGDRRDARHRGPRRRADARPPLFGAMPELDSLAVLELVTASRSASAFKIDDDDSRARSSRPRHPRGFVERHRPQ